MQVFLQLLVVHGLLSGERGGDGWINAAEVQPACCRLTLASAPGSLEAPGGEQRAQGAPGPGALHAEGPLGRSAVRAAAETIQELITNPPEITGSHDH